MIVQGSDGEIGMSVLPAHAPAQVAEGNGNRKLFHLPVSFMSYDTAGSSSRAPMEAPETFAEADCGLPQVRTESGRIILANLRQPRCRALRPQVKTLRDLFKTFGSRHGRRAARLNMTARTGNPGSRISWKPTHIGVHQETFEPAYH